MHPCMHTCTHIYTYLCMCTIHTHVHTYMHTHAHMQACTQHTHTYTHVYNTNIHMYSHSHTYSHIYTYTHMTLCSAYEKIWSLSKLGLFCLAWFSGSSIFLEMTHQFVLIAKENSIVNVCLIFLVHACVDEAGSISWLLITHYI